MPIRARFGDRAKSGTFVVFASRSEEGSVLDVSRSPYEHDEFSDAHCLLFVRLSPWYVTSLRKSRNAPVPRGKRSAAERTRWSNFPPEMNERLLSCTSIVISFFRQWQATCRLRATFKRFQSYERCCLRAPGILRQRLTDVMDPMSNRELRLNKS